MQSLHFVKWLAILSAVALVITHFILLPWIPKTKRGWKIFAVLASIFVVSLVVLLSVSSRH